MIAYALGRLCSISDLPGWAVRGCVARPGRLGASRKASPLGAPAVGYVQPLIVLVVLVIIIIIIIIIYNNNENSGNNTED